MTIFQLSLQNGETYFESWENDPGSNYPHGGIFLTISIGETKFLHAFHKNIISYGYFSQRCDEFYLYHYKIYTYKEDRRPVDVYKDNNGKQMGLERLKLRVNECIESISNNPDNAEFELRRFFYYFDKLNSISPTPEHRVFITQEEFDNVFTDVMVKSART